MIWINASVLPMPDEGLYLIFIKRKGDPYIGVATQTEEAGLDDCDGNDIGYEAADVAYWMQFPEAPPQKPR